MGRKRNSQHVSGSTRSHVELLLAESVPSVGQTGDIVRVKPGFARNYLIPPGLATVATDENRLAVERHRQRQLNRQVAEIKELGTLAEKINNYSATIEANANADGHLYGSVSEAEIAKVLNDAGLPVEPDQIKLEGLLKELGMYTVTVELHEGISTEMKVWVVPGAEETGDEE